MTGPVPVAEALSMPITHPFPAVARLRQHFDTPPPTDADLLGRFAASRDEDAFRELVRRHGPAVLAVCRRVAGNRDDADDAFQATFLVLARKPGRVRAGSPLGGWLYGVAVRAARKAVARTARRRGRETAAGELPEVPDRPPASDPETVRAVLEEVARLSDPYRAAVVLCELEGRPRAAAARELGIAEGTLSSRLAAARKRLARRFRDRGLAPAVLAAVGGSAACPVLAADAARLAGPSAPPVPRIEELSEAVMRSAILSKWNLAPVAAVLAAVGLTVTAADPPARPDSLKPAVAFVRPAGEKKPTPPAARPKPAEGIAWGETVDGLQAGLTLAGDDHGARIGESARFVVRVRNVGDKPAKLTYRPTWFYTSPPAVTDDDGKPAKVVMPPKPDFPAPVLELSLGRGESLELINPVALALAPADEGRDVDRPTARVARGSYKVRYGGLSTSHPKLQTGQVKIAVESAAVPGRVKKAERLSAAAKRLVGSWEGEDGSTGPAYREDGTGKNPDGSTFEWRLEGDYLVARRPSADGKPGEWAHVLMLLARDGKEYKVILDKEYSFFRRTPGGERGEKRTNEDRTFPRQLTPQEDGDSAPTLVPNKPGQGRRANEPAGTEGVLRVGPTGQVSKTNAGVFHTEVVLAADPADARRLAAAAMYLPPSADSAGPKVVVYASADGGKSWVPTLERKDAFFADPAFAWGAADALYVVNMMSASLSHVAKRQGGLQVVRSGDGGRTWGPAATIDDYHDRPFLAVDSTGGQYHGRLYCLTHKGLLASADAGKSFGPLRSWERRPGFAPYGSGNPVVLSDGTLVVVYNNSSRRETPEEQRADPARDRQYLAARTSRDGGGSFSDERVIADYRGAGYPRAAAAPAPAPWQDRIYVVWQETLPAGRHGIKYASSKDRGATFSSPVLLSEQSGSEGDYDAFVPGVAVNKAGVVAVTWYDTRGLQRDEGWNVRIRVSPDGGETWRPSVPVTDVPALQDKGIRKRLRGREVGHTAGLVADADGVFHCLWVDNRSGVQQVWTAAVEVKAGGRPADPKPLPKGPNRILVNRAGDLTLIDPDGKNEKRLDARPEKSLTGEGRLSPDGKRIAYVAAVPDDSTPGRTLLTDFRLYVREVGGNGPGTDLGPAKAFAWSPDGTEVAATDYTATDGLPDEMKPSASHFVADVRTGKKTALDLPADHIITDWSRDGKYLVTTRLRGKKDAPSARVFLMNRDGTEHKAVTDGKVLAMGGRLSPDGRRVMFMELELPKDKPPVARKLVVADVATGATTPVEGIPLDATVQSYCWSPDGKRVAYSWRLRSDAGSTQEEAETYLVVCDPDGRNEKTVLTEKHEAKTVTLAHVDWR